MQRQHIWGILYCAGVRNGLQFATSSGETISEHMQEAMHVVRPLMFTKWGSLDRSMYDRLVWEVTAYLMASDEHIRECINGQDL